MAATAATYRVKRLCHTSFLSPGSISSLFTGERPKGFPLASRSVKCKLSLTGKRASERGLTGEPSIQMMSGGRGGDRESLSLHCVSITLKRKLIHSALNCMPRPPMCLPPPPSPHNVEEAIFKQTSQDSHFKRCNEFLKNIMVYIILYIFFFFEQEEVRGRKKKKKREACPVSNGVAFSMLRAEM